MGTEMVSYHFCVYGIGDPYVLLHILCDVPDQFHYLDSGYHQGKYHEDRAKAGQTAFRLPEELGQTP